MRRFASCWGKYCVERPPSILYSNTVDLQVAIVMIWWFDSKTGCSVGDGFYLLFHCCNCFFGGKVSFFFFFFFLCGGMCKGLFETLTWDFCMCSCSVLGLGSLAFPLSGLRCCFWLLDLGRMSDLGIVMEPWLQLVSAPARRSWRRSWGWESEI